MQEAKIESWATEKCDKVKLIVLIDDILDSIAPLG